ncbi:MAG: hypothetical protein QMD09_11020, partial [Desulfatibacillaceae bacterium]|nr:hypothetical protein [Desulfatibacillaceae bacterium]
RIFEELKCLGENAHFVDPGLARCYRAWLLRHREALLMDDNRMPQNSLLEKAFVKPAGLDPILN